MKVVSDAFLGINLHECSQNEKSITKAHETKVLNLTNEAPIVDNSKEKGGKKTTMVKNASLYKHM